MALAFGLMATALIALPDDAWAPPASGCCAGHNPGSQGRDTSNRGIDREDRMQHRYTWDGHITFHGPNEATIGLIDENGRRRGLTGDPDYLGRVVDSFIARDAARAVKNRLNDQKRKDNARTHGRGTKGGQAISHSRDRGYGNSQSSRTPGGVQANDR